MKQFWQYDDEHNRALGVLRAPGWTQGDLTPEPEVDLEVGGGAGGGQGSARDLSGARGVER